MPQDNDSDLPRRMHPLDSKLDYMLRRGHDRREKMIAEIQANRRGEYKVPTWVLALMLVAIVGGFAALLIFA
jgi:hypothetical protein